MIDFTSASTTLYDMTGFRLGSILDFFVELPKVFLGASVYLFESLLPIILVVVAISAVLSVAILAFKFFHR